MEKINKCKCGGLIVYQQDLIDDEYKQICQSCKHEFGRFSEEELRAICWRNFYDKEVIDDSL